MKTWCGSDSGPGFARNFRALLGWIRYLIGKVF